MFRHQVGVVSHSVTGAFNLYDDGVVQQSVEQSSSGVEADLLGQSSLAFSLDQGIDQFGQGGPVYVVKVCGQMAV